MVDIIYTPQDAADPSVTEWHGFVFEANKPTSVPDGHALVGLVEGNPWFSSGGKRKKKQGPSDDPTTPEEYRAYAIKWINESTSSGAMTSRWDNEEPMRRSVGWGSDDDDAIAQIFQPKLDELKKSERLMAS